MSFTFVRFKDGGVDQLEREERISAAAGYSLYFGQALKISGGTLIYAQTGDQVYAICGVSAASSVVTAAYKPVVFPVNNRQIWKAEIGTAVTAAVTAIIGKYGILDSAGVGTAIDGNDFVSLGTAATARPGGFYVFDITTASTPKTSAAYVIFPGVR
jgi:hypothetical protein